MDVFFYIKREDKERVLECGLKLSEWANRNVFISGIRHECIKALLNPADDKEKLDDDRYVPLKIRVNPAATIVAEGMLYDECFFEQGVNSLYNDSVILLEKYVFGSYRRPECLLTSTVGSRYFDEMNRGIDVPILYSSSEELYLLKQLEYGKSKYTDFEERLLYRYYKHLSETGVYRMYVMSDNESVIFRNENINHIVSLRKK